MRDIINTKWNYALILKGYGEKIVAIRINNINLGLNDELDVLEKKICKKLNISKENINKINILNTHTNTFWWNLCAE